MRPMLACALIAMLPATVRAQLPAIIDVHLHAWNATAAGPEAAENKAYLRGVLALMDSLNIVLAVVSGPEEFLDMWTSTAPARFLAAPMFPCDRGITPNRGLRPCFRQGSVFPDTAWLRSQLQNRRFQLLGELTNQYAGIRYDDPRMEPYYALAEEFDLPVAVHVGAAPPLTAQGCCPKFRVALGDPLIMEEVLVRHPRLRVHLMHGNPERLPQILNLLQQYPQLHVDLSPVGREQLHSALRIMQRYRLLDRVMFGTDCAASLESSCMRRTVEAYTSAAFLTQEELNGILCGNASRFLRRPQLCVPRS